MKKKLVVLMLAVSMLTGMMSGCTIGDTEFVLDMNNVGKNDIFSINGSECTKDEARLYLCNYQNIYGQEYGVDLWKYDYSDMEPEQTLEAYVKDVTIAELANVICMSELAKERELALTEKEEELLLKVVDEYYNSLSEAELSYMGIDKDELKKFYEKYALAQKLYRSLTEGISEEVSDDEARVVQIQQIYVADEAKAQEVQQKLQNGENFETIAATYNEAEEIELYLARDTYADEVDKVVFNMENNTQSGMITTENGYYFIKCLNKYVEDLTEANKAKIVVQRRKEQFDDVLQEFIETSEFELNEEVWESIKVDTSGNIKTNSFFATYDKYFVTNGVDVS